MGKFEVNIPEQVFNEIYYPELKNFARIQIGFGGSGSGKSVFYAQRCVIRCLSNRNQLIARQVARTLRKSVFNQIESVINDWGLRPLFETNKSEMTITCSNGKQILFAGLDDVEKLKSIVPVDGPIHDVWVEEATETRRDSIKQLMKRQRGGDSRDPKTLTMTFNPILQSHWVYKEYFEFIPWTDRMTEYKSDQLTILKTWYIHNRFLTPQDVYDLENEGDEYFRDVYTFGNWGVLGNLVFRNFDIADLSGMMDQFDVTYHGLDFGFSNDPAAYVACAVIGDTIYIYDEVYGRGMLNDELAALVAPKAGFNQVICDSAEPKSIAELQRAGVNATDAAKGKDSVTHGVQWIKQYKVIIDERCVNTIREFQTYQWQTDKYGEPTNKPQDRNNHAIDALRYALEPVRFGGWAVIEA